MVVSRNTRQKEELRTIIESFETFFDAEDILAKTKIGIATIYRFLKEEVKAGRLHSYTCNRRTVYSKNQQHCHMVNAKTGTVQHFNIKDIDFLEDKIPGSIVSIQVEVTYTKP